MGDNLQAFGNWSRSLKEQAEIMPALFIGHGSPMNAIENNSFSAEWARVAKEMPVPVAVLVVSAHWLTRGTFITAMSHPKTIHDFGGFPDELFAVQYPAPGYPELAVETAAMVQYTKVGMDHEWGLDHGAWSVVKQMYPDATIPVLQLSIDFHQPARFHYELAAELRSLRKKGVLILGSGNMVHNLRMIAWDKLDQPGYGYDWAIEMHELFNQKILNGDHEALIQYEKLSPAHRLAIPTPDHYYPLLYTLGVQEKKDVPVLFNNQLLGGSLNMTSVLLTS